VNADDLMNADSMPHPNPAEAGVHAGQDLLPLVYNDLRRLAAARMAHEPEGQTLQPTALVHEAWAWLMRSGDPGWKSRAHFFGAAAQAMRQVLIENARRKSRLKRGGAQERCNIDDLELGEATADDRLLLIHEALERLEKEDPEQAQLVLLKFFGGLTNQEAAVRLGVTERTVERNWAFAKARLYCMIRKEL
jgi:RNA polymerase sigma factor (TIGR02999 family)